MNRQAYRKIAKKYHVSVAKVKKDMQETITSPVPGKSQVANHSASDIGMRNISIIEELVGYIAAEVGHQCRDSLK